MFKVSKVKKRTAGNGPSGGRIDGGQILRLTTNPTLVKKTKNGKYFSK
jgi:hypothetical protein